MLNPKKKNFKLNQAAPACIPGTEEVAGWTLVLDKRPSSSWYQHYDGNDRSLHEWPLPETFSLCKGTFLCTFTQLKSKKKKKFCLGNQASKRLGKIAGMVPRDLDPEGFSKVQAGQICSCRENETWGSILAPSVQIELLHHERRHIHLEIGQCEYKFRSRSFLCHWLSADPILTLIFLVK